MLKQTHHSLFQSYVDYGFIAPKSLKHKANMYIYQARITSPTFCRLLCFSLSASYFNVLRIHDCLQTKLEQKTVLCVCCVSLHLIKKLTFSITR